MMLNLRLMAAKAIVAIAFLGPTLAAGEELQTVAPPVDSQLTSPAPSPAVSVIPSPTPSPSPIPVWRTWGFTVSAAVPHPIWLDGNYRANPKWSFAIGVGGLSVPLKTKQTDARVGVGALDVRARWHPFKGVFFLGGTFGFQAVSGKANQPIHVEVDNQDFTIDTTVEARIGSAYLTPHLGWFWVAKNGFTLGLDFGIQVPLKPKTEIDVTTDNRRVNVAINIIQRTEEYQKMEQDLKNLGDKLGRIPLPYFTVLRLGYSF